MLTFYKRASSLGGIGRHDRLKICSFLGYRFNSCSEQGRCFFSKIKTFPYLVNFLEKSAKEGESPVTSYESFFYWWHIKPFDQTDGNGGPPPKAHPGGWPRVNEYREGKVKRKHRLSRLLIPKKETWKKSWSEIDLETPGNSTVVTHRIWDDVPFAWWVSELSYFATIAKAVRRRQFFSFIFRNFSFFSKIKT